MGEMRDGLLRKIECASYVPEPKCGAKRGEQGTVTCELSTGHDAWHLGRGSRGQVFIWSSVDNSHA
jgi:hypothetical protein